MQASLRSRLVTLAIVALLAIIFYVFVVDLRGRELVDFSVYLEAAKRYARGENIYQYTYLVPDRWGREIDSYYFYPPFLAHLLASFLVLGDGALKTLWLFLSYLCLPLSALLLARLLHVSWWKKLSPAELLLLVLFFVVCFEPVYWGISDGQVTAFLLLSLATFLLALVQGREYAAGTAIALAISIKMSPALLVLSLLRFRRSKVLVTALVLTGMFVLLLPVLSDHSSALVDFWHSLTAVVNDESRREFVFNFVFDKALLAVLGLEDSARARVIVKALLLGAAALYAFRWKRSDSLGEAQLSSALICFMVLCSPILWFHHLAWLVIPLAVLSMSAREGELRLKDLTAVVGLFFALSQVNLAHYWALKEAPGLLPISALVPGMLIIIILCLLWAAQKRDTPVVQPERKDRA